MAILLDFNPVVISAISVTPANMIDKGAIRHMALNMILSYKNKFSKEYGELIICCDSGNTWRKDAFPYYKIGRKKTREESALDWKLIMTTLDEMCQELKDYFPYKVIKIDRAEADDIIAVLANYIVANNSLDFFGTPEPIMIVSGDKDFKQLHSADIHQYAPVLKKRLYEKDPVRFLLEHIVIGDKSDSIPNIRSQDDVFALAKRQSPITEKFLESILESKDIPSEYMDNFKRNQLLVDLSFVPLEYKTKIIEAYLNYKPASKIRLSTYMMNHGLKQLYDKIQQF